MIIPSTKNLRLLWVQVRSSPAVTVAVDPQMTLYHCTVICSGFLVHSHLAVVYHFRFTNRNDTNRIRISDVILRILPRCYLVVVCISSTGSRQIQIDTRHFVFTVWQTGGSRRCIFWRRPIQRVVAALEGLGVRWSVDGGKSLVDWILLWILLLTTAVILWFQISVCYCIRQRFHGAEETRIDYVGLVQSPIRILLLLMPSWADWQTTMSKFTPTMLVAEGGSGNIYAVTTTCDKDYIIAKSIIIYYCPR